MLFILLLLGIMVSFTEIQPCATIVLFMNVFTVPTVFTFIAVITGLVEPVIFTAHTVDPFVITGFEFEIVFISQLRLVFTKFVYDACC